MQAGCKMQTEGCRCFKHLCSFFSKWWRLSDGKKGSWLRLFFWVVDDVPEKKGMDLLKQMSSSKCSITCICGIFCLPRLQGQFMLGLHFPPACLLLSVCSLHFTHSLHFTPGLKSTVRSAQSEVRSPSPQSCYYTERIEIKHTWHLGFQESRSSCLRCFIHYLYLLRSNSLSEKHEMNCLQCKGTALEYTEPVLKCLNCGHVMVLRSANETTSPQASQEKPSREPIADFNQETVEKSDVANGRKNDSNGKLSVRLLLSGLRKECHSCHYIRRIDF